MKKIISLMLVGALMLCSVLSFTACGENTVYSAVIDGQNVEAGIYIYYLNMAYNELYGKLTEDAEVDSDYDVYAQKYEEKSATDWIVDRAYEFCAEYVAVNNEAERLGVKLSSDQKSYIENMVDYYWNTYNYSEKFGEMGISQNSFKACLSSNYLASEVFLKMYGENGEKAVSDDDLFKFLTDNYARVKYYPFSKSVSDSDSDKEGQLKALETTAKDLIGLMNAEGGSFDSIISEYEKLQEEINSSKNSDSDTSDTDTETDEDTSFEPMNTDTEADPYERETLIYKEAVSPSEDFVKMVFEKKPSDYNKPFFYEDSSNYYVVEILDVNGRKDYIKDNHDTVLSNYKYEEFNDYISELAKNLKVEKNNSAIKRYEPKKLGVPAL